MKKIKIILLLNFIFTFEAFGQITSWFKETGNCNMLIHIGCPTNTWTEENLVVLSGRYKDALINGRSGFTNVEIASRANKKIKYDCRTVNAGVEFGMIMDLKKSDKNTCIRFFTKDKNNNLEIVDLNETFNQIRTPDNGVTMEGNFLCSPFVGKILVNALGGELGHPPIKCGVHTTRMADASDSTGAAPVPTKTRRGGARQ